MQSFIIANDHQEGSLLFSLEGHIVRPFLGESLLKFASVRGDDGLWRIVSLTRTGELYFSILHDDYSFENQHIASEVSDFKFVGDSNRYKIHLLCLVGNHKVIRLVEVTNGDNIIDAYESGWNRTDFVFPEGYTVDNLFELRGQNIVVAEDTIVSSQDILNFVVGYVGYGNQRFYSLTIEGKIINTRPDNVLENVKREFNLGIIPFHTYQRILEQDEELTFVDPAGNELIIDINSIYFIGDSYSYIILFLDIEGRLWEARSQEAKLIFDYAEKLVVSGESIFFLSRGAVYRIQIDQNPYYKLGNLTIKEFLLEGVIDLWLPTSRRYELVFLSERNGYRLWRDGWVTDLDFLSPEVEILSENYITRTSEISRHIKANIEEY